MEPFDGVLDVEPKDHKQEPLKREEEEDDKIFLETNTQTHTQKGFLSVETLKDRHHLFISIIRRLQRFYSSSYPTYQHEIEICHWPLLLLMDFSNRTTGIYVCPGICNPIIPTCRKKNSIPDCRYTRYTLYTA